MKKVYEPVIGLEVHVELNTKTKMFCRCSADYFGKKPNTHTCPVCLGLPGALPYINEEAIKSCIKIGLALGCSISEISRFERKNYFYPDLPKGYQISQYRWPLCTGGRLQVTSSSGEEREIRINRVHQEEDTAKLIHRNTDTLIDFNRSGVPLVEIVTEPDFHDSSEVRDYAKKLQQIFRYLGVSNADMEKGEMRLEANVSVRLIAVGSQTSSLRSETSGSKTDEARLPNYRVELKNINSFRFMVAAIEYEIKRQIKALEKGEKLTQETRGWDEEKKETYLQRSKEEAHDYRYFPDPDLPELRVKSLEFRVKEEIPGLPEKKMKKFIEEFGLSYEAAKILTEDRENAEHFEEIVKLGEKEGVETKQLANIIINKKLDLNKTSAEEIMKMIQDKGLGVIGDVGEIEKIVQEVINENPKVVEDFKKGKQVALQFLIGMVMRKSEGKVDISKVKIILAKSLQ